MKATQVCLEIVLLGFAGLTGYAVYEYGYVGFFATLLSNVVGLTVAVDLIIALSLVLVWMVRDARAQGMSVLPYALLTFGFGSVGPLLYLLRRRGVERA